MAVFGKKGVEREVGELRDQLAEATARNAELQQWVTELRGTDTPEIERQLREMQTALESTKAERARLLAEAEDAWKTLASLQARIVETRELALLQEVGIYEYSHPLQDAVAFKGALTRLRTEIKAAVKSDAVTSQVDWAVDGSAKAGQKTGRDIARLMLRAYNTEADNAVRSVKPHTRQAVKERLSKSRDTIGRLGAALHISIGLPYHRLRLREIDLTADYLMRLEVEREEAKAERVRLREEAKAMKELEREGASLAKERAHHAAAVEKLRAAGDEAGAQVAQAKVDADDAAVAGIEERAANVRAGYVYVISNIGAFGPDVVKIGLTRRLKPMDWVRELGDASVPFRFDCHALFFADDAVSLEGELHARFADHRLNLVNRRSGFFFASPTEVKDALLELGQDHILEFVETPEAIEWRASSPGRWRSTTRVNGTNGSHLANAAVGSVSVGTNGAPSANGVR